MHFIPACFNKRESILYSLGIGCTDLRYLYESSELFQPFPTILLALTLKGDTTDVQTFPPPSITLEDVPVAGPVLDAERYLELFRPLRPAEELRMRTENVAIATKISGVVAQSETVMIDGAGQKVCRIVSSTFYVGSKGVSDRGKLIQLTRPVPSNRKPDKVAIEHVSPRQAVLYRLSGDYNPLHIDPETARIFGFQQPILHGLCSLGIGVRVVVASFLDDEASVVRKVACRFSKPTFPGSVLRIEMWQTLPGSISFRVIDDGRDVVVVDQAYVDFVPVSNSRL